MRQDEIDNMRKLAKEIEEYRKVGNVNISNLKEYNQVVADILVMFPKLVYIIDVLLQK